MAILPYFPLFKENILFYFTFCKGRIVANFDFDESHSISKPVEKKLLTSPASPFGRGNIYFITTEALRALI
jgi:hypothetical protein